MFKNQDIFGYPIGINYYGSGTYKTKLGALITLLTYALLLFNTITLTQAFFDNSKQDEKNQFERFDRYNQTYNLKDMEFSFSYFTYPPLTPNIGRFKVYQKFNCDPNSCDDRNGERLIEIPTGDCPEAKKEQDREYWLSRIPGFVNVVDQYQCV